MPLDRAVDPQDALARARAHSEAEAEARADKVNHKDGFFAAQRRQWQVMACLACESGDLAGLQKAVRSGLKVDEEIEGEAGEAEEEGEAAMPVWQPIHIASHFGHLPIVRWILEQKSSLITSPTYEGLTPLQLAEEGMVEGDTPLAHQALVDFLKNELKWSLPHRVPSLRFALIISFFTAPQVPRALREPEPTPSGS